MHISAWPKTDWKLFTTRNNKALYIFKNYLQLLFNESFVMSDHKKKTDGSP